ncbi:hypothetical protein POD33_25380 [Streptomyces moderatus]|nr:hypothetical protein POD33_25380 [Streptomyces moderatus]
MSITALTHRVRVLGTPGHRHDEIPTPAALDFPWAPVDEIRAIFERTALAGELPLLFTPDAYSRHLVRRTEAGA